MFSHLFFVLFHSKLFTLSLLLWFLHVSLIRISLSSSIIFRVNINLKLLFFGLVVDASPKCGPYQGNFWYPFSKFEHFLREGTFFEFFMFKDKIDTDKKLKMFRMSHTNRFTFFTFQHDMILIENEMEIIVLESWA